MTGRYRNFPNDMSEDLKNRLLYSAELFEQYIEEVIKIDRPQLNWIQIRNIDVTLAPSTCGYKMYVRAYNLTKEQMKGLPEDQIKLFEFIVKYDAKNDVCFLDEGDAKELGNKLAEKLEYIADMFRVYDTEPVDTWPMWKLQKYIWWRIKTGHMTVIESRVINEILNRRGESCLPNPEDI